MLGNAKVDETKRAALQNGIKEALLQDFIQLRTQTDTKYDKLKWAIADLERLDEVVAFQSRTDAAKSAQGSKIKHRWRE